MTHPCLEKLAPSVAYRRQSRGRRLSLAVRYETARSAIGALSRGMDLFIIGKGAFSLTDVLAHCVSEMQGAAVTIAVWSAGDYDLDVLARLHSQGRIASLRFVCDFSFERRKPEICARLIQAFGYDAVRVTSCHMKIILIRSESYSLTITTSANLNANERFEAYSIIDDASLYDFVDGVVAEIWRTQRAGQGFTNTPYQNIQGFKSLYRPDGLVGASVADLEPASASDLEPARIGSF